MHPLTNTAPIPQENPRVRQRHLAFLCGGILLVFFMYQLKRCRRVNHLGRPKWLCIY